MGGANHFNACPLPFMLPDPLPPPFMYNRAHHSNESPLAFPLADSPSFPDPPPFDCHRSDVSPPLSASLPTSEPPDFPNRILRLLERLEPIPLQWEEHEVQIIEPPTRAHGNLPHSLALLSP